MSIDDTVDRVEQLKSELELMRQCYKKGLGNDIWKICLKTNHYLEDPSNPDRIDTKNTALDILQRIEEQYSTIPFDQLEHGEDFSYLFVCRELLDKFIEITRQCLERPEEGIPGLQGPVQGSLFQAIIEVGQLYKSRIHTKLDELRTFPGYEDYQLTVTDRKNHKFVL